jgi:hypothetical protein
MGSVHFEITIQDIEMAESLTQSAHRDSLSWPVVGPTPASVALERVTGSKWKTVGSLMVMEERAPFRFGVVPATITPLLESFLTTGQMEPCHLDLDFHAAQYSFSV